MSPPFPANSLASSLSSIKRRELLQRKHNQLAAISDTFTKERATLMPSAAYKQSLSHSSTYCLAAADRQVIRPPMAQRGRR
jgi:hypothetical protein